MKILEKTKTVMIILTFIIIVFSSLVGVYRYLEVLFSKESVEKKQLNYYRLRIFMSESLVLALTFLLGVDIIESVIRVNYHSVIRLVVVFLFRLAFTYFVDKDITKLTDEKNKLKNK